VRAVVLVKQVPDLRASPVGLRPDGTIDRERAAAITNPADRHALEAALRLADEVWALSMGPPQAEATLREALALGARRAVLLCDRALAGSDTWATANALAAAITHLGGADLVCCGTTALDGETGQVGPQVAARLGWPQATAVEDARLEEGGLVVRRVVEGGYEELRLPLPALVTVAETGFAPHYPTLPDRRRAGRAAVERLGAAEAGIPADRVGLVASPTKVAHMAPAPLPDRACRFVDERFTLEDLAAALREAAAAPGRGSGEAAPDRRPGSGTAGGGADPSAEAAPTTPARAPGPEAGDDAGPGTGGAPQVWVVGEVDDGRLGSCSAELCSKAVELADALGGRAAAFLAGASVDGAAAEAARYGAEVVYAAEHPDLEPCRTEPHTRVLVEAVRTWAPEVVCFSATTTGRDLAPRVAAMLDTGLAADCTDLRIGPWARRGHHYPALLHAVRPAMAGGVMATCVCPEARPQMATVRPGLWPAVPRPRPLRRVDVPVRLEPADLRVQVLARHVAHGEVALGDADVIVAGGAGCDATTWPLVEELAAALGGRVAASRGAVEAHLAPRARQVGQTGVSVHPRLYVACGISGALQHVVGMRAARTVVAINRDPDALIFRLAHYGVIGDVREVLPRLIAALRLTPGRV
jgi:electron transfer flavoprotein alpha subunit